MRVVYKNTSSSGMGFRADSRLSKPLCMYVGYIQVVIHKSESAITLITASELFVMVS